jgi:hypothetical protein
MLLGIQNDPRTTALLEAPEPVRPEAARGESIEAQTIQAQTAFDFISRNVLERDAAFF